MVAKGISGSFFVVRVCVCTYVCVALFHDSQINAELDYLSKNDHRSSATTTIAARRYTLIAAPVCPSLVASCPSFGRSCLTAEETSLFRTPT